MYRGFIGFIKLVSTLLLFPIAVAVTLSFHRELLTMNYLADIFGWGLVAYVLWHIFVCSLLPVYQLGLKGFSQLFSFSSFLAEWVPRAVPLGTLVLALVYYVFKILSNVHQLDEYFVFIVGLTLSAHIVLTAQDISEADNEILKTQYVFSTVVIYILSLITVALLLDLNSARFSSHSFFNSSWDMARSIYDFLYRKFLLLH